MKFITKIKLLVKMLVVIVMGAIFLKSFLYFSRAEAVKANIVVDNNAVLSYIPFNWKSLAQGGEESGVRMLQNVVPQLNELQPDYIRLDHIYDFYDVVHRVDNQLVFNWDKLDATVCDIYASGAKPFFSLGYMPPELSSDGSLIAVPKSWQEWTLLVQKTIEHYSGKNTILCGGLSQDKLTSIYYEVWNEPDLETFGKWSIYGGEKDYKRLYYYSVLGAQQAQSVNYFLIGGPATTRIYKNWLQTFVRYVNNNHLRLDFISWHHYTPNTEDFTKDSQNIDSWLSSPEFSQYRHLPQIISEWGYDSNPNQIADTNVGAAYTVAAIKNLIDQNVQSAFAFEIKDGNEPRWGILSHDGVKKPRFYALKFLNLLDKRRLKVDGEGSFIQAIASKGNNRTTAIIVNYDPKEQNVELVPVTFINLSPGTYHFSLNNLNGSLADSTIEVGSDKKLQRSILMPANMVVEIEISQIK